MTSATSGIPALASVKETSESWRFRNGQARLELAVDVRHFEHPLEELGVLWPHVVQGAQEERRDAQRSVPAVASPLAALPTQLATAPPS